MTQTQVQEENKLEDTIDFWTIDNVEYRNGIYQVDLSKKLLGDGVSKTQDQWVEYSKKAIKNNEFYVADFPLYHAIFTSLYRSRDNQSVKEIREFLEKQFFNFYLSTLTRIKHKSQGEDIVIHNYGLENQYEIQEDIVGPDEYVKNSSDYKAYKAILGTDNLMEINSIYNWITGRDAYLWRVNQKPRDDFESVARFGADSDRAGLDCSRNPVVPDPSLGVRAKKILKVSLREQILNKSKKYVSESSWEEYKKEIESLLK